MLQLSRGIQPPRLGSAGWEGSAGSAGHPAWDALTAATVAPLGPNGGVLSAALRGNNIELNCFFISISFSNSVA